MARKSITTSHGVLACDVCGRTLLRGENADPFIAGGSRRLVCELCTGRAANEGWIRESDHEVGVRPSGDGRRRSLLARLRRQGDRPEVVRGRTTRPVRERAERPPREDGEAAWASEPDWGSGDGHDVAWTQGALDAAPAPQDLPMGYPADELAPAPPPADGLLADHEGPPLEAHGGAVPEPWDAPEPGDAPGGDEVHAPRRERRRRRRGESAPQPPREPRHVHAVPADASLKLGRALEVFNASGHARTVAGVARSLGEPLVSTRPSPTESSIVVIVVGWELCWYRYEVDLADEAAGVRVVAQGAELDELEPHEREANAAADDGGALALL